jgi:hypothetical protein
MNSRTLPRRSQIKHLSQIERRLIMLAWRHRADYLRLVKRMTASASRNGRYTLAITTCAVALFATTANAQSNYSAAELFNQANAAQRAGRLGPAILGYERARLLSPNDSSVEQNLRIAREKAGVTEPRIPTWQRPARWLSFDSWALFGTSALFMGCVLFCAIRCVPRRAGRWIGANCAVAVLLAATAIAVRWNELDRAVIQNPQATAHIAPAADAQSTFELKAGEVVNARRDYGEFVLVRTLDQRSGWVKKSDLERIIPSATNLSPM